MKKLSKVFLAMLAIVSFGVLVSCGGNKPVPNEELKTEEVKKALEEIQLNTANVKSEYYLGQAFSSSGLTVKAIFNDNSEEDISTEVVVDSSSFDANALGQYSIKVSYTYEGRVRTGNYTVQVKTILDNIDVYIVGLNVSLGKVTYNIYEDLDLSDLQVTAVYSDDSTEQLEEGSYTIDNQFIDKTRGNISPLIVSTKKQYSYNQISQEIEVKNFVMISYLNPLVSIAFKAGSLEFEYGSVFSTDDWKVEATYQNEEVAEITGFTINKRVNTHLSGTTTVVISYEEWNVTKTCSVQVVIKENPNPDAPVKFSLNANDVELINPLPVGYVVDDFITLNGGGTSRVDANSKTYTNGTEEFSFSKRINLNGKVTITEKNIQILMPKAGKIRVIFSQGNVGRQMSLMDSNFNLVENSTTTTQGNDTLVEYEFTVTDAGYYYLGCQAGGIYVWYVSVEA